MDIKVEGLNNLRNAFEQYARDNKAGLLNIVASASTSIESKARQNAPRDLGKLKSQINHVVIEKKDKIEGRIRSDASYSLFVEEKTKPHWTSQKNLIGWARRKGIPVRLVQKSIAEKGTQAQPFMAPAAKAIFPKTIREVAIELRKT
jgi:HK97 gp10 family phage protein